jgi:hypothetical protein
VAEPGFAVAFNVDPQGSELDVAATATDTVLYLGDASDYDAPSTVRVDNGTTQVDVDIVATDVDAGTVTLATALGIAADVSDRVYILTGDEIAYDHDLEVHTSNDAPVFIPVDPADRLLWPEGPIDPPVPVVVSDDLTEIVDIPGRRSLVNPSAFVAPLFVGYLSSGQSIPTGSAFTTVTSWVTRTLTGGMTYDATLNAAVVPLSGWYAVSNSALLWEPNGTGRRAVQPAFISLGTGTTLGGLVNLPGDGSVRQTTAVTSPLQALQEGDAVTLTASQSSGAALSLVGDPDGVKSFFCVEYRGPL